jgi:hypothetical protein
MQMDAAATGALPREQKDPSLLLDLLLQALVGVGILGAGLWFGYQRWIAPRSALDLHAKGLLALLVLTLMGGLIGSPFWWFDEPRSFSWDLPPLASRMLSAAGLSFVVGTFLTLQRPSARRIRLILIMLAVYLAPLVAAILLFHLDRFDFSAPISYAFFAIAGGMTLATLWYLLRRAPILDEAPHDHSPTHPFTHGWLALVAALTLVWGLALFATDSGPAPWIWVWSGDLLTSRLIGVMLLAIAAGALASLRHADSARVMLAVVLTYGMGLALAGLWNVTVARPLPLGYVLVFGALALGSAGLLVRRPAA